MMIPFDPGVFKAYDVRGLYPSQINEPLVELIGRGFVAHLGARRIAVSRDMRLSSPALAGWSRSPGASPRAPRSFRRATSRSG